MSGDNRFFRKATKPANISVKEIIGFDALKDFFSASVAHKENNPIQFIHYTNGAMQAIFKIDWENMQFFHVDKLGRPMTQDLRHVVTSLTGIPESGIYDISREERIKTIGDTSKSFGEGMQQTAGVDWVKQDIAKINRYASELPVVSVQKGLR